MLLSIRNEVTFCRLKRLRAGQEVFRVSSNVVSLCLHVGETVDRQSVCGCCAQVAESDVWCAFLDHQVHNDERLEGYRPGRVAEAVGQGTKHLCDTSLAGLGRQQDVLDILGLGRRELDFGAALDGLLEGARHELGGSRRAVLAGRWV